MGKIVITGSASGIGAAIRRRMEGEGHSVIGVDLRDAEVAADLSTPEGRAEAMRAVRETSGGALDGVVACAGLGPQVEDLTKIVAVNYFGAQATLAELRDLLAAGEKTAAVAISSNSSTIAPTSDEIVAACLNGNETEALRLAAQTDGSTAYASAKLALARWVRRNAPAADWAGAGVRLNAVAPGAVTTPLLQQGLDDKRWGEAIRSLPIPLGDGFGSPDQIAAAVAFLLGPDSSFCCGSILYADGGSDALIRPDKY
jgi:NAD(P)-dependent dehydrogenase (short-subunit alcohol dehydrogenase family)